MESVDQSEISAHGNRLVDLEISAVVELLRRNGYVYFVGFSPSQDEFEEFAKRFGHCAPPRVVGYPRGGAALGFHAEDAYNPWRPDALWFLCVRAGSGSVPTGVVDGVQLLADMADHWRRFSRDNSVKFTQQWPAAAWQPEFGGPREGELDAFLSELPGTTHEFLPDGMLRVSFVTAMVVTTPGGAESFSNSMLQAATVPAEAYGMTLVDDSPVPEEFLQHVGALAQAREKSIGWSDGDIAVIDNYRFMHRRSEYTGTGRDLRALHCDDLFGSGFPATKSPLAAEMRRVLQTERILR